MSVLGNATIDKITGLGSSNLAYVDRADDAFGAALNETTKSIREGRSGTASLVKRRQDAIDDLIQYLINKGMDRNEAELEALDTYNYLLDNPLARGRTGAQALDNFPEVLNIGGGTLIREYEKKDIKVELKDSETLSISSDGSSFKNIGDNAEELYDGIAARGFSKEFKLSPYMEVTNVTLENGILEVQLAYELPEEKKSKLLTIN